MQKLKNRGKLLKMPLIKGFFSIILSNLLDLNEMAAKGVFEVAEFESIVKIESGHPWVSGPHFCKKFEPESRIIGCRDSATSPSCFLLNFVIGWGTFASFNIVENG